MSSDFYLTLPSNASADLHPENTLTHYITTLPQRIRLSGQWECGMVEIQYPHSWYNVRSDNASFAIATTNSRENYDISKGKIEAGYYHRPERMIAAINKTLKKTRRLVSVAKKRRWQKTYLGISQPRLSSISYPVRESRVNWTCLVDRWLKQASNTHNGSSINL